MRTITRKLRLWRPHGLEAFLLGMYAGYRCRGGKIRLLDVGCGNDSVERIKRYCPGCYYIGIDIGDYNLRPGLKGSMEEYHVVNPQEFAEKILEFQSSIDVVVSNHNLEHCNEPGQALRNMISCLRSGGGIFLAFPSEESANFPHRGGTLNFYDDETHQYVPDWDQILLFLEANDMKIRFKSKNYRPFLDRIKGKWNEKESIKRNKVLAGTWAYWGFESIIWGIKR